MKSMKTVYVVCATAACQLAFAAAAHAAAKDTLSVKVGGLVQVDGTTFHDNKDRDFFELDNGTDVRRGRIYIEGKVDDHWGFRFMNEFSGNEANELGQAQSKGIKDAYITYTGLLTGSDTVTVGQFKTQTSLEQRTDAAQTTFLERALPTQAFQVINYAVGVGYNATFADSVSVGVSVNTKDAENKAYVGNEEGSVFGRVAFAPYNSDGEVLHLGVNVSHIKSDRTKAMAFVSNPEARSNKDAFLIGAIVPEDSHTTVGAEVAGVWGPFAAQAEYLHTSVDLVQGLGSNPKFKGGYVQASYFITGESRSYDLAKAAFGQPKGVSDAWELAGRYSQVDFTDKDIGSEEKNFTLGVNWYANEYVRFGANYLHQKFEEITVGDRDRSLNTFGVRAQVAY